MIRDTLMMSLPMADCSKLLLQRRCNEECSVADYAKPCQWYSQCRGGRQVQALLTRKSSNMWGGKELKINLVHF